MKANVGFRRIPEDTTFQESGKLKVITGKWGCGVFGGIPVIKIVMQWIAASLSGRDMVFTTF